MAIYKREGNKMNYTVIHSNNGLNKLGKFESLEEARNCIYSHDNYKKSWFTKKGKASSSNPNAKERFSIVDNNGDLYFIK
jgi:hypothetical protein